MVSSSLEYNDLVYEHLRASYKKTLAQSNPIAFQNPRKRLRTRVPKSRIKSEAFIDDDSSDESASVGMADDGGNEKETEKNDEYPSSESDNENEKNDSGSDAEDTDEDLIHAGLQRMSSSDSEVSEGGGQPVQTFLGVDTTKTNRANAPAAMPFSDDDGFSHDDDSNDTQVPAQIRHTRITYDDDPDRTDSE